MGVWKRMDSASKARYENDAKTISKDFNSKSPVDNLDSSFNSPPSSNLMKVRKFEQILDNSIQDFNHPQLKTQKVSNENLLVETLSKQGQLTSRVPIDALPRASLGLSNNSFKIKVIAPSDLR